MEILGNYSMKDSEDLKNSYNHLKEESKVKSSNNNKIDVLKNIKSSISLPPPANAKKSGSNTTSNQNISVRTEMNRPKTNVKVKSAKNEEKNIIEKNIKSCSSKKIQGAELLSPNECTNSKNNNDKSLKQKRNKESKNTYMETRKSIIINPYTDKLIIQQFIKEYNKILKESGFNFKNALLTPQDIRNNEYNNRKYIVKGRISFIQ